MATQSNSRAPRGGPKAHACSSPHAFCSYAHPSLAAFSSPTSRRSARARRPSCGRPRPRRLRRAGSCAPTRRAARRSPRAPPACAPRQRMRAPRPNATAARRLPPRGRAAPDMRAARRSGPQPAGQRAGRRDMSRVWDAWLRGDGVLTGRQAMPPAVQYCPSMVTPQPKSLRRQEYAPIWGGRRCRARPRRRPGRPRRPPSRSGSAWRRPARLPSASCQQRVRSTRGGWRARAPSGRRWRPSAPRCSPASRRAPAAGRPGRAIACLAGRARMGPRAPVPGAQRHLWAAGLAGRSPLR